MWKTIINTRAGGKMKIIIGSKSINVPEFIAKASSNDKKEFHKFLKQALKAQVTKTLNYINNNISEEIDDMKKELIQEDPFKIFSDFFDSIFGK
jgi:hypothetical protein